MQTTTNLLLFLCWFLASTFSGATLADTKQPTHAQPLYEFVPDFSQNSRWALDLSTRATRDLTKNRWSNMHVIGFDYHKIFSGGNGDIGTLTFQPYWVRLVNVENPPFFFENSDDSELTWRIANFNYTALSNGQFNVRLGHFEVPFGLEQNIDTNGTIRQYTYSDRGIKADWGISVNGVLPSFDYEIALTRGSGNDITDRHNPYLFSGRIGTPSTANFIAGLSWFNGEILNGSGTVKRKRVGLDLSYYYYQWELLFELSAGEDDNDNKVASLVEVSWRDLMEDLHGYVQYQDNRSDTIQGWQNGSQLALGMNWNINTKLSLSGEWAKELDTMHNGESASQLLIQLRSRI